LPRAIGKRLLALKDHFGLGYAAFDLILSPGGRHVFLELNASGDYADFERVLRFPISDAIADLLVNSARRSVPPS
jgi:hypothetical protein